MRHAWLWLGLVLLLALPSPVVGQHGRGESSRGLNGAVEKLLEHRTELGLTDVQLTRVQVIKDSADARKQPLWRQIMRVRRDLKARQKVEPDMPEAEKKALLRRSGEQIEQLLDEVRRIDHAAMREVGEVFTEVQKEKIREMVSKSRRGRDHDRSDHDHDQRREGTRD